jgi:hypothetical protein
MRRTLLAVAVGLLTFAGSAWADSPIVRWSRIEGVIGADVAEIRVGPIYASTRWRTTGSGSAMVNLKNGFLSFRVTGASVAKNYANAPLGSPTPAGGASIGTVVCNATERFGPIEWANTPVLITKVAGTMSFEGFIDLPASCGDRPDEVVFLIRHPETAPFFGAFNFYGADRTIGSK